MNKKLKNLILSWVLILTTLALLKYLAEFAAIVSVVIAVFLMKIRDRNIEKEIAKELKSRFMIILCLGLVYVIAGVIYLLIPTFQGLEEGIIPSMRQIIYVAWPIGGFMVFHEYLYLKRIV